MSPTARHVLRALLDHEHGVEGADVWPSIPTLMAKTGYWRKAVRDALKELSAKGKGLICGSVGAEIDGDLKAWKIIGTADDPDPREELRTTGERLRKADQGHRKRAVPPSVEGGSTLAGGVIPPSVEGGSTLAGGVIPPSVEGGSTPRMTQEKNLNKDSSEGQTRASATVGESTHAAGTPKPGPTSVNPKPIEIARQSIAAMQTRGPGFRKAGAP